MTAKNQKLNNYVNVFVSVGAAVVIFGAWAKILHLSFANTMLTIGLLTEAVIFLIYAFLPPTPDTAAGGPVVQGIDVGVPDPNQMKILSQNIAKFNDTLAQIKDVADMHAATSDYTQRAKEATIALGNMKEAYQHATTSLGHFSTAADSTKQFHEQVQSLTKNLNSLNNVYEVELQGTANHFKAINSYYGNLVQASEAMQGSIDDAKKAQEQINLLSKNLSNLNAVYGNMLAAMQGR